MCLRIHSKASEIWLQKERGTAKPKWNVKVYIVLRLLIYTQKVPVFEVDWHQAKVCLAIKLPGPRDHSIAIASSKRTYYNV